VAFIGAQAKHRVTQQFYNVSSIYEYNTNAMAYVQL